MRDLKVENLGSVCHPAFDRKLIFSILRPSGSDNTPSWQFSRQLINARLDYWWFDTFSLCITWCCNFDLWPWTVVLHHMSRVQIVYKIWVKSNDPQLNYWRFSTFFSVQFLTQAQISGQFPGVSGLNFTKLGENIGPSSPLIEFVIDFKYLASFQNARRSNANGVKNWRQILHLLPPVKIKERAGKRSE